MDSPPLDATGARSSFSAETAGVGGWRNPLAWFSLVLAVAALALALRHPGARTLSPPAQVLQRLEAVEAEGQAMAAELARLERLMAPFVDPQAETAGTALPRLVARMQIHRLVLAGMQLGLEIRTHQPFQRKLELVRRLGREVPQLRPILDHLERHAATGVATATELRDAFGVILLPKLQALEEAAEPSWTEKARGWWGSDRDGEAGEPPSSQSQIEAAMDRLGGDDLRGAIEHLAHLENPQAALVARWLTEAQARLEVDAAHDALTATLAWLLDQAG